MSKPFLYFDNSYISDISNKIDYINPKKSNIPGAVQDSLTNSTNVKDFVKIATNLYKITKITKKTWINKNMISKI